MHPYPHHYQVSGAGRAEGDVLITAPNLPDITTAPPVEFDGPGDRWSPEALLIAAVADCFILSFRGVARAQKIQWEKLECDVEGTLERVEGKTRFTKILVRGRLVVPPGVDAAKASAAMVRAEQVCLISNSLNAERHLEPTVTGSTA